MKRPLVSIIIPSFNRENLLPRALDSVLAQTFTDWEIILVDDGSTDDTPTLAREYGIRLKGRMQYIRQTNAGCCAARNRGIENARGDFVAFLDSDDEFLPQKLQRQLALFELRPDLGLVYSDYAYIDLNGLRHESVFDTLGPCARDVTFETVGPGLGVCVGNLFDVLLSGYFIATIVGLVRREVLARTIRFPFESVYSAEWLFYLKVVRACRAGFVDEPLCLHHHTARSKARGDVRCNHKNQRKLAMMMQSAFEPLSRHQSIVLRHHLANACRQIGYDNFKSKSFGRSARYLFESLRHKPSARTTYDLAHAGLQWAITTLTGKGNPSPEYDVAETIQTAS